MFGVLIDFVFQFCYFSHQYLVHQKVYRPWYRNIGLKEMVESLNQKIGGYDQAIITKSHNDPYIYFLFYNRLDPGEFQKIASRRANDKWEMGEYLFFPVDCPSHEKDEVLKEEKILFVDKGECVQRPYVQLVEEILRPDHTVVFNLLEVDQKLAAAYFEKVETLSEEAAEALR